MLKTPYRLDMPVTVYPSEDVLIADITATDAPYLADATGENDCSDAIQRALGDCAANGGGTVFLPCGKYRLEKGVRVPAYVTLRGDCNPGYTCADDCGTLILADTDVHADTPLFSLGGSGGVKGLTVYYPRQSLDDPIPYPPAFYVDGVGDGYMLQTVENVTVINGYIGIEACTRTKNAHEQFTVDSFRGTFLHTAAEVYNQADVGTWKNVDVSPEYWARFDSSVCTGDVRAYTRENCTALTLGDLEWTEFLNLSVSGCKTAIHIVKGKRIEFAGSLFGLEVRDCVNGVIIDKIDERWGMCVAHGSVEADVTAFANNTKGILSLTDVEYHGAFYSSGTFVTRGSFDTSDLISDRMYVKPANNVFTADFTRVSDVNDPSDGAAFAQELQCTLDFAESNGGGAVYVPAGKYNLCAPVRVPGGVELRGSSSVATREQGGTCKGTVILVRHGVGSNTSGVITSGSGVSDTGASGTDSFVSNISDAAVTLYGENAGVNGIRFVYPDNPPYVNAPATPCVRGLSDGVYCVNCAIAAASVGLEFVDCAKFFVKKLTSCCYRHSIHAVNCVGGHIEGCLQNGTAIVRTALGLKGWLDGRDLFPVLFDKITRAGCEYIRADGCLGLSVVNTFAYGVMTFASLRGCGGVRLYNTGADNIGTGAPFLRSADSEAVGVCLMRYNGHWFDIDLSSQVLVRGAIAINEGHTER